MPARKKLSYEERLALVKAYLAGQISWKDARKLYGDFELILKQYQYNGPDGLKLSNGKNKQYPESIKLAAVTDYLAGLDSKKGICAKYKISGKQVLNGWLKVYNEHGTFDNRKFSGGGSYMKKTRKTTFEERIRIAKECIDSGHNYGAIALKYDVSYQQVRTWSKNYSELGEAGVEDRRGKRIATQTPRTVEEELRVKLAQLEHENYMLRVERDLLKKLDELERGNAFRK